MDIKGNIHKGLALVATAAKSQFFIWKWDFILSWWLWGCWFYNPKQRIQKNQIIFSGLRS